MSVRKQAYEQTMRWLNDDHDAEALRPPEGLHPLALAEWRAGHEAALKRSRELDESWTKTEDLIVFVVKLAILYAVTGAGYWLDTWFSWAAAAALDAHILWRYWGPHGEKK